MNKTRVAIILTIIAASSVSFWAGGRFGKRETDGSGEPARRRVVYYSDPMNPGFRSDEPGIAPCGMPLEPVYAESEESPGGSSLSNGAVRINTERRQLIGVRTAAVERRPMTYTLRLYGKVVPDETRIFRVNASTDSWIRKLSDVTTGSIVRRDQLLAEALAPAYYNAQVTYLIALDNVDRIRRQLGGELRHQQGDLANNQIRVAVQALQNLGIGDAQIEELAKTRRARPYLQVRSPTDGVVLKRSITRNQWFKAAEEFYTIADIRHLWIYADVYENEARHIAPGMAVRVNHAQLGKAFEARVSEVLPLFDPLSKTLKVRLDVGNPHYDLRPDMFVDVELPIRMPPSLHVPADAVIDSGTRNTVYVETGDGIFEPRAVETGWRLGRRIEITGGIRADENVVVSGNFLIDSESRMKTAAAGRENGTIIDLVCGMEVRKDAAERAELVARHEGETYYFCSRPCAQAFDKDPQRFAARPAAAREEFTVSTDPVCGMNVHREIARNSGRTAAHDGETFYFCSRECLMHFQSDPGTYTRRKQPVTGRPVLETVDLKSPPAGKRLRHVRHAAPLPQSAGPGSPDARSPAPEIVDWKGPEAAQPAPDSGDWNGWGRFPGAEYLGLHSRAAGAPAPDNAPVTDGATEPPAPRDTAGQNHLRTEGRGRDAGEGPAYP